MQHVGLQVEAFVHVLVAVVVQPVAGLLQAGAGSGVAVVAVPGAGGDAVLVGVEVLVRLPVTVLVDPVADLLLREPGGRVAVHGVPLGGADEDPHLAAGADPHRARLVELRVALVDVAVAVVVDVVAQLPTRDAPALAAVSPVAVAVGEARVAAAHTTAPVDARGRGVGRHAGLVACAAVRGVVGQVEVLVGAPIAVVVHLVAGLDAAVGRRTFVFAAVGDLVVQVTEARLTLGEGAPPLDALEAPVGEAPAVLAAPSAVSGVRLVVEVLVHAAVAVVVRPVADLEAPLGPLALVLAAGGRISVRVVEPVAAPVDEALPIPAPRASVGELAGPTTRPTVVGVGLEVEALVDPPVTVIVEVVTGLGLLGLAFAAVGVVAVGVDVAPFAALDHALAGAAD